MTEVSNTKTDSVESVESVENNKSTGASNYKKAEKLNFHTRGEALSGSFQLTSDDIQLPAAAQEVSTPRLPDYCGGEKFDLCGRLPCSDAHCYNTHTLAFYEAC